ncbi:YT521-B-like domain-containing protein [Chaetomium sp. MPI-CAGE-AT-0009]|nr:YT521-B-like domain-containing protein [Chaetomium sp. MPI-CAGE-AT-0009]
MAPRSDLGYYSNPIVLNQVPHAPAQFYYSPGGSFPGQTPHGHGQLALGQYRLLALPQHQDPRTRQPQHSGQEANAAPPSPQSNGVTGGRQSIVRGPPRKPRQSGHAIWVGNLPPQTDLMSLVHHVCKETEGLESLFLISKSNLSRLRKSTVEGPAGATAPTGPAASTSQVGAIQEASSPKNDGDETNGEGITPNVVAAAAPESQAMVPPVNGKPRQKDRFFVLKSLTVEDLELSVRTNIWATQSHNEEVLNSAYKTSDNVYLIFSANKSGEYFGYARMASAINEDPAAAIEFAPSAQPANEVDLPKAIPTEPTEFAPKGRIIDDSARGTIFWEACWDDKAPSDGGQEDEGSSVSAGGDTVSVQSGQDSNMSEPKAWGKPFRLEWLSTTRLPFFHTRGLRNSFNSNREVKIARDGTEIEPTVARTLIGKFYRAPGPALGMLPPPVVPGGFRMQAPVTVGYPPMR